MVRPVPVLPERFVWAQKRPAIDAGLVLKNARSPLCEPDRLPTGPGFDQSYRIGKKSGTTCRTIRSIGWTTVGIARSRIASRTMRSAYRTTGGTDYRTKTVRLENYCRYRLGRLSRLRVESYCGPRSTSARSVGSADR